jgi:hypothetical protein
MGNSKDRRKLRRQLQDAGLGHLLSQAHAIEARRPPAGNGSAEMRIGLRLRNASRRALRWILGALGALATLASIAALPPWLSVSEGAALSRQNPYSTLFNLTNEGYLPTTDLDADCVISFEKDPNLPSWVKNMEVSSDHFQFGQFARQLNHSGRATVPCFRALRMTGIPVTKADLKMTIGYYVWPFRWPFCRKRQSFRFSGARAEDGEIYWTYLN